MTRIIRQSDRTEASALTQLLGLQLEGLSRPDVASVLTEFAAAAEGEAKKPSLPTACPPEGKIGQGHQASRTHLGRPREDQGPLQGGPFRPLDQQGAHPEATHVGQGQRRHDGQKEEEGKGKRTESDSVSWGQGGL